MQALRKRGVRLALDRFGHTASIAHLRKLMCDEIRVDPSFLADLQQDAAVQAMLLGIGDLARRLRVPCGAGGVDTQAQLGLRAVRRAAHRVGLRGEVAHAQRQTRARGAARRRRLTQAAPADPSGIHRMAAWIRRA